MTMLKLTSIADPATAPQDALLLPFEARQKSRLLASTERGVAVGLFLPRGHLLRAGVILTGPDNYAVRIEAAPERLSVVRTDDVLRFARACYHLGNRHVSLQIAPAQLAYLADHVLDDMVAGLGLDVTHEELPFEPEGGAYHGHDH